MVPKVFDPLKFNCILSTQNVYNFLFSMLIHVKHTSKCCTQLPYSSKDGDFFQNNPIDLDLFYKTDLAKGPKDLDPSYKTRGSRSVLKDGSRSLGLFCMTELGLWDCFG